MLPLSDTIRRRRFAITELRKLDIDVWLLTASAPEPPEGSASASRGRLGVLPGCRLDQEGESIATDNGDRLAHVGSGAAPRRPDLARDAHLTAWTAGRDDGCLTPDQGLRTDRLATGADLAVPEQDLANEGNQPTDEADEVPGRGEQKQEDERNDEEHATSLGGRIAHDPVGAAADPAHPELPRR